MINNNVEKAIPKGNGNGDEKEVVDLHGYAGVHKNPPETPETKAAGEAKTGPLPPLSKPIEK